MAYPNIGSFTRGVWIVWKDNNMAVVDHAHLPPQGGGRQFYWLGDNMPQINSRIETALTNTGLAQDQVSGLDVSNAASAVLNGAGARGFGPRNTGQSIEQLLPYGLAAVAGVAGIGGILGGAGEAGAGAAGAEANAAKNAAKKDAKGGGLGGALSTGVNAVKSIDSGAAIAALVALIGSLFSTATWATILKVLFGVILVGWSVFDLAKKASIPIPKPKIPV